MDSLDDVFEPDYYEDGMEDFGEDKKVKFYQEEFEELNENARVEAQKEKLEAQKIALLEDLARNRKSKERSKSDQAKRKRTRGPVSIGRSQDEEERRSPSTISRRIESSKEKITKNRTYYNSSRHDAFNSLVRQENSRTYLPSTLRYHQDDKASRQRCRSRRVDDQSRNYSRKKYSREYPKDPKYGEVPCNEEISRRTADVFRKEENRVQQDSNDSSSPSQASKIVPLFGKDVVSIVEQPSTNCEEECSSDIATTSTPVAEVVLSWKKTRRSKRAGKAVRIKNEGIHKPVVIESRSVTMETISSKKGDRTDPSKSNIRMLVTI